MEGTDRGARAAHLVGSIPAESADAAMALACERLGDTLRWLPDGETGERRDWVQHIIKGLGEHPDFELARAGDWSDYDSIPRYRVRRGHRPRANTLPLGYATAFRASYPAFRRARAALGNDALAFQVGIPGDFDLAFFALGPARFWRWRGLFRAASAAEMAAIHAEAGDDVVFQLELPAELVLVARAPRPVRRLVAARLARGVAKLVAAAPAGVRMGIHLCLGDMNHKALAHMPDLAPVVELANALVAAWPQGRALEYVHFPFAGTDQVPPTDPAYYAPLAMLRLPASTRLIVGLVHEHDELERQRELLAAVERLTGHPVDVSAACGLARRSRAEAEASLERARELARG